MSFLYIAYTTMEKKYEKYWELIVSVIKNEAGVTEQEIIKQWLQESPDHQQFFKQTAQIIRSTEEQGKTPSFDQNSGWTKFIQRVEARKRHRLRIYIGSAAAIILLVSLPFFFRQQPSVQIHPGSQKAILILDNGSSINIGNAPINISRTNADIHNDSISGLSFYVPESKRKETITYSKLIIPQGGEYKLTLPDSTQVWLNSESEIRFPSHFGDCCREVEFTGEAYFKVTHNPDQPFYVKTSGMSVKVYGTEFNIHAYPDEDITATTLIEGKVSVIPLNDQPHETVIAPSQQLTFSKIDKSMHVKTVETSLYTSWREGIYAFEDASLEDIFNYLGRWYMFDVDYKDEKLRHLRFTGEFQKDKPIEYGLKLIRLTCEVNFKIQGSHILVTP